MCIFGNVRNRNFYLETSESPSCTCYFCVSFSSIQEFEGYGYLKGYRAYIKWYMCIFRRLFVAGMKSSLVSYYYTRAGEDKTNTNFGAGQPLGTSFRCDFWSMYKQDVSMSPRLCNFHIP